MSRYKLLSNSKLEPKATAGTIVYDIRGWDYGLAKDDTRMTGVEHVSVTLDPEGDCEKSPSFTIPKSALELCP